jgi:isoleucyl-tRNA synthetase
MLGSDELAELFIVSEVVVDTGHVVHGPAVATQKVDYAKCGRCWRHLPEVADDGALCDRCAQVLA